MCSSLCRVEDVPGNQAPVARCTLDQVLSTDPLGCFAQGFSIEAGSFDPDGDPLEITQFGSYLPVDMSKFKGQMTASVLVRDPAGLQDSRTDKYGLQLVALGGTAAGVGTLEAVRRIGQRAGWPSGLLLGAPAALLIGAVIAAELVAPQLLEGAQIAFSRLMPRAYASAGEARSMMAEGGIGVMLRTMFGTGIFAAIPAALLLVLRLWRPRREEFVLLTTWTAAMLVASIGQVRFGYYLAIPVALLGGRSRSRRG